MSDSHNVLPAPPAASVLDPASAAVQLRTDLQMQMYSVCNCERKLASSSHLKKMSLGW